MEKLSKLTKLDNFFQFMIFKIGSLYRQAVGYLKLIDLFENRSKRVFCMKFQKKTSVILLFIKFEFHDFILFKKVSLIIILQL